MKGGNLEEGARARGRAAAGRLLQKGLITCCLFHMLAGMEAHLDASIGTLDASAITGPAFAPLPANLVDEVAPGAPPFLPAPGV